jgi:uncharacterized sporulation protein YeaH/YhbH (DUF444 family)
MDIERDQRRFKQIVRGRIRDNLRKYITHGEMIGRKGRDLVSIPVPQLDVPRFKFGKNGSGGVWQGDGQVGDPVGKPGQGPDGAGGAGSDPGGGHYLEVEVSLDELAQMLGDELELPRIKPKGAASIEAEKTKYNSIRQTGPESLRHLRRTYLRALKRQISTGSYEVEDPRVIPVRPDKQYRSWNDVPQPQVNAAVIYMMDVSGSMTDEQKEIVRTEAFWIDAWLGKQYKGVEKRYIIHDAVAKEVDEQTFYHTRESGGTRISSAYKTSTASNFPTATTGATTTARRSNCSAKNCCRRRTCSATGKSKALTAAATSSTRWRNNSATTRSWCCRRLLTRMRYMSRFGSFGVKGNKTNHEGTKNARRGQRKS